MGKRDSKGKTKGNYVASAVLCIIAAIALLFVTLALFVSDSDFLLKGKMVDLNQTLAQGNSPQKDDHVQIDALGVLGQYAETKHTINGIIPAGKEKHYVAMLDESTFISVTVKGNNNVKKFEDASNDFLNAMMSSDSMPKPVHIEGRIKVVSGELDTYFTKAISSLGVKTADGYNVYHMDIDTTSTRLSSWGIVFACIAISVCFIFGALVGMKNAKNFMPMVEVDPQFGSDFNDNNTEV